MASAPNKVERGHQLYRDGRYHEALVFYTDALSAAKTKPQKITFHSNRAACYLKLHDFKKAAEECTSVLELDHKHNGALMLWAQTLVTLREYHSALFYVNRLIELNPNSEVYQNLEARLRTQLSLAPILESEAELEEEEEGETEQGKMKQEEEKVGKKGNLTFYQKTPKSSNSVVSRRGDEKIGSVDKAAIISPKIPGTKESCEPKTIEQSTKGSSEPQSKGWQAIPKPKGHSALDYARWDRVEDNSNEDDDEDDDEDDEDSQPQYQFRVRTVGVRRPVK